MLCGLALVVLSVALAVTSVETDDQPPAHCGSTALRIALSEHASGACRSAAESQVVGGFLLFGVPGAFLTVVPFGLAHHARRKRARARALAPTPKVPAIATLATRRFLTRYLWKALLTIAVGVVLIAGFTVAATIVEDRAAQLQATGRHARGVVVADRSLGGRLTSGRVKVRWRANGEDRVGTVTLNDDSPQYHQGQTVDVVYDPRHPRHFSIDNETNQSDLTVLPMILVLIAGTYAIPVGGVMLVHRAHWRTLLSLMPWTPCVARFEVFQRGRARDQLLALLDGPYAGSVIGLVGTAPWRRSPLRRGAMLSSPVWIAGDPIDGFVIGADNGGTLYGARRSRSKRRQRRWEAEAREIVGRTTETANEHAPAH